MVTPTWARIGGLARVFGGLVTRAAVVTFDRLAVLGVHWDPSTTKKTEAPRVLQRRSRTGQRGPGDLESRWSAVSSSQPRVSAKAT